MPENAINPLSWRTRWGFALGSAGEAVYTGLFNTFITIFYNQALGLPNTLIGTAVMIALLADAVMDPVIGYISDHTRSRFGRRHLYLFAAPLPLGLATLMIFHPPEFLLGNPGLGLFLWLLAWTVISRISLAVYFVPHLALGGELTSDYGERSKLFSVNAILGYATGAMFAFVAWGYFLAGKVIGPQGVEVARHLDRHAYAPMVVASCLLIFATIWISSWATLPRVAFLSQAPGGHSLSLGRFYGELRGALRNRNYLVLVAGFFLFMISSGLLETFGVFVNTFFWELAPEQIKWIGLVMVPGAIGGALIAPALMRRFDRKPVLLVSLALMVVGSQIPILLRLAGLFPENQTPLLLPILLAQMGAHAFVLSIGAIAILSMLGDIIDADQLAVGYRREGMFYSARVLFGKGAVSIGHLIAGIALDLFVRLPPNAVPGQLPSDMVVRLGILGGPVMVVGATLSLAFYARYRLTRAEHEAVLAQLKLPTVQTGAIAPVSGGGNALAD